MAVLGLPRGYLQIWAHSLECPIYTKLFEPELKSLRGAGASWQWDSTEKLDKGLS